MTKRVKKKKPTILIVKQPEIVKTVQKIIKPEPINTKKIVVKNQILVPKNIQIRSLVNTQDTTLLSKLPPVISQLLYVSAVDETILEDMLEIGTLCFTKYNLYFDKNSIVTHTQPCSNDNGFIPQNYPVMYAGRVKYKFRSNVFLDCKPVILVCHSFYANGVQFIPQRILLDLTIPEYIEKTQKRISID